MLVTEGPVIQEMITCRFRWKANRIEWKKAAENNVKDEEEDEVE
jgi:hypothetical protein